MKKESESGKERERERERERARERGGGKHHILKGIFLKKDNLNNVFMLKRIKFCLEMLKIFQNDHLLNYFEYVFYIKTTRINLLSMKI